MGSLWLHPASDFRIPNAVDGKTLAVEGPRTSTGFSGFSIMNPAWPFLFAYQKFSVLMEFSFSDETFLFAYQKFSVLMAAHTQQYLERSN